VKIGSNQQRHGIKCMAKTSMAKSGINNIVTVISNISGISGNKCSNIRRESEVSETA
jgi:hypothetical protein